MKKVLKFFAGLVVVVGAFVFYMLWSTSGERDLARSFIIQMSSGDAEGAYDLFHPQFKAGYSLEQFVEAIAGVKPYTEVSFNSVARSTDKPTEIKGTATTADECESAVELKFVDETIVAFDIQPLCRL